MVTGKLSHHRRRPKALDGHQPADGQPFTSEQEWARSYTYPDGSPRYPPDRGAAPGTLRTYYDADQFTAQYGRDLDRVGPTRGRFLGVPPGATWGERALPPGNIDDTLYDYELADQPLPANMKIEVAKIAPGFGQPGGGTQVPFIQEVNGKFLKAYTMDELKKQGVLIPRGQHETDG